MMKRTISPIDAAQQRFHLGQAAFRIFTKIAHSLAITIVPGRHHSRSPFAKESGQVGGTPSFQGGFIESNNMLIGGNRSRTSSAVSLPANLHSTEEVFRDAAGLNCSTPQRFTNQFERLHEDAPSTTVTGLSSVFRDSPHVAHLNGFDDQHRDENIGSLGFASSSSLSGNHSLQPPMRKRAETDNRGFVSSFNFIHAPHSFGDSRIRASTWDVGLGLFGTESNADDRLADDLASILKLSEVEQKDSMFAPPGF
jgi:hypothetical protein